jgi:tetratricopeptide (TPR) repeat protein
MTIHCSARVRPGVRIARSAAGLLTVCTVLASVGNVLADTVTLKSGRVERLIRIRAVKDGKLLYRPSVGRAVSRRLSEIQMIEVARLDDLNAAEVDFAAGRFAEAAQRYEAFLPKAERQWQELWSRYRLLCAYDELGQFAKAVKQYCALVVHMPGSVALLMPRNWPAPSSTFYTDALDTLQRARDGNTTEATDQALNRLILRIKYKVQGHTHPAASQPDDDLQAPLDDPELMAETLDPEMVERLNLLVEAFERRAYARTVELADELLPEVDNQQAAEVLLLRGKALFQQAVDPEDYFEAALSLMRVVIHLPDSRPAAESGYYAGLAMERTENLPGARRLLEEAARKAEDDAELARQIQFSLVRVGKKLSARGGGRDGAN